MVRTVVRIQLLLFLSIALPVFAQGEFTPIADGHTPFSRVHFFPKNGNQIVINGVRRTIPPGVGVISGGAIGVHDNASIDKVLGQKLAPRTLYYVYVYMRQGVMTLDFSRIGTAARCSRAR